MSTVAEIVRHFDRRSRHYWEHPRLGGEVYWPTDQSWLVYVPAGRRAGGGEACGNRQGVIPAARGDIRMSCSDPTARPTVIR